MSDEIKSQRDQRARPQVPPRRPKARRRPALLSSEADKSRLKNAPPPNSIRHYRRLAHVTLEDLAGRLGISRETIRRLEERDTWLDAERAAEIGNVLGVPKEFLGFSDAPDAYAWAARAVPVVGSVIADDEVRYRETGRRVAGGSYLPSDAVAVVISKGKLRGWMLFCSGLREPIGKDILERQGPVEKFIVHLENGTTWWRHIEPASERTLFHLNSPRHCSVTDVDISWVSEVVALQVPLFDLPTQVR